MTKGIGVDIVQNSRFEKIPAGVEERLFTAGELSAAPASGRSAYLASRFAAKEALVKALGTGFRRIQPRHIAVEEDSLGCPHFVIDSEVADLFSALTVHLSLSHEKDYSVAMVVLDGAQ